MICHAASPDYIKGTKENKYIDLARGENFACQSSLTVSSLRSHPSYAAHLRGLLVLVPAAAGQAPGHLAGGGAGGEAVRLSLVDLVVPPDPDSVKWQVHVDKLAILQHNLS